MSSSYVWLGAAAAATAAVTWLGRRGWRTKTGKVRDVMIPSVVTIEASATLVDAARQMKEANVGVLPIVDGGILRGIVTDRDLVVRAMAEGVDPARTPVVNQLLSGDDPIVAVTDYLKLVPDQISRWVPLTALGTDGYGRSDTRDSLRRFFEVDTAHIVVAVLAALARRGSIDPQIVADALVAYGLDAEAADPAKA